VADPTTTKRARAHVDIDSQLERIREQRAALKDRHAQALARLMAEREDLKGVHPLADLVSDSLRWSA
jgi:hypothetical protein